MHLYPLSGNNPSMEERKMRQKKRQCSFMNHHGLWLKHRMNPSIEKNGTRIMILIVCFSSDSMIITMNGEVT